MQSTFTLNYVNKGSLIKDFHSIYGYKKNLKRNFAEFE